MYSSKEEDFCVACLITDVKMYSCISVLNIYFQLLQTIPTYIAICNRSYRKLLKSKVCLVCAAKTIDDKFIELKENQKMCYECIALLMKYSKFREKCCKAQEVLCNLEKYSLIITKDVVRNIDRKEHNLSSNIAVSPTKAFFDLEIDDNDSENALNVKVEDKNLAVQDEILIKIEKCNDLPEDEIIEIPNAQLLLRDSPEFDRDSIKDKVKEVSLSDSLEDSDLSDKNYESDMLIDSSEDNSSYTGNAELDNFIIQELGKTKLRNIKYEVRKEKREKREKKAKPKVKRATKRVKKTVKKKETSNTSKPVKKIDLNELRKYVDITYLTHETAMQEVQLRKEKTNYKNSVYKCELCFKGFGREITFQNHMHTHDQAFGTCECDYCHVRFHTKYTLNRHFMSCHKMKICCKKCVYECFCVTQAQIHVRSHEGRTYTCEDCGKVFRMPNSLSTHRRLNHIEGVPCDLCGESLGNKRGLVIHKRSIHTLEKNNFEGPKCDMCNVHFANEKAWKRHLVLSKNHDVRNGCEVCGETFANDNELNFHKTIHVKEKIKYKAYYYRYWPFPSECPTCNKSLNSRRAYEQHVRQYHPKSKFKINTAPLRKEYVCEICAMVFPSHRFSRRNYLMHLRKEHPSSDLTQSLTPLKLKQYVCEVCGSMFRDQCVLKYHQKKHINHKQRTVYNCDKCSKTFLTNAARSRHIKITHFGIRPYSCPVCGKSFHNQCEVNLHRKYVHEKVPWPKRDRSKRNMKTE